MVRCDIMIEAKRVTNNTMISKLCQFADQAEMAIRLIVAYDTHLVGEYYRRFGFHKIEHATLFGIEMRRLPQ